MAKFKLPRKVTKLEEAPAAFRQAYVESEGAFHLDPERLESIEWDDREELAGALERERKERREARADLEKYKDIDPEKAREALARLDEIDNRKLRDKGEFDRLMEKKQAEWTAEKAALEAQVKDSGQQLRAFRLTNKVKEAALKAGVLAEDVEDVLTITSPRFDLDEKGNIVVKDADGDPTGLTLDNFFGEVFKTQRPKFYGASGAGGSGAPAGGSGGGSGGAKTIKRADLEKLAPADAAAHFKSGGTVVD